MKRAGMYSTRKLGGFARGAAALLALIGLASSCTLATSPLLDMVKANVEAATANPGAVAIPVISPGAGAWLPGTSFAITCATAGAAIHYTADGTTVTASSPIYTSPISWSVNGSYTIEALATKQGMSDSSIVKIDITINDGLPNLSTAAVSNLSATTATSGGEVVSDGGHAVTGRGVCWATSPNPTVSGSKTSDGAGTGVFTSNLTGLVSGTLYYLRAWATNSAGTTYGNQVSFQYVPSISGTPSVSPVGYPAGSGKLAVSWTPVTGATSYDLYYSTTSNPPAQPNGPTDLGGSPGTIAGLTNYTTYYVWVVAKTASASSPLSSMGSGSPGVHVTSVSLDKTSCGIAVGATSTLTATMSPADATDPSVAWSSDNATISKPTASGQFTAQVTHPLSGQATITATSNDTGYAATCTVSDPVAVTDVSLNFTTKSMTMNGGTATLVATVTPPNASNKAVAWESSDTNVATVSSTGVVTHVGSGEATISATTVDGGFQATCAVDVRYAIGDTGPAGGIVFYDAGLGASFLADNVPYRYLEAAPANLDQLYWLPYSATFTYLPGATGTGIGAGKYNTSVIIGSYGTSEVYAARSCLEYSLGGKTGEWYLPSKDENDLLFTNLISNGFGNFPSTDFYCTSSMNGTTDIWCEYMDTSAGPYGLRSTQGTGGSPGWGGTLFEVRPIRAFN